MLFAIGLCYVVMAIGFYRVLSIAVDRPRLIDAVAAALWPLFLLVCGTIFPLSVVVFYWRRRRPKTVSTFKIPSASE